MIKQYLTIFFLSFIFWGCNKDLLDKYPTTTLNPNNFWNDANEAETGVNALYTFLPGMSHLIEFVDYTEMSVMPTSSGNALVNGQIQVTSGLWWNSHFRAVAACNRFLEQVNTVPDDKITPDMLSRLKAEARFIRAVNYTFLVNYYGDVPLFTNQLSLSEASVIKRTDKQAVLDFIEKELTEIANDLPLKYTGGNIGRITKGAALAWKARAMLWSKQYQKAADAAKAVIDLNQYELYPDYAGLFKYSGEYNNKEVILEYIYTNITGHDLMRRAAPYGISNQTSNLSINPTVLLVNQYETINGLAPKDDPTFDADDPYKNRDPRLQATIWLPVFKNGSYADTLWGENKPFDVRPGAKTKDEVFREIRGNQTGFLLKKYLNREDMANITNSSQNYIILRYADVLLMYAEAKIELNQIDASVIDAIDEVRTRAHMPTLQESGVSVGDQSAMREAVRHERTVELAMEGWRFYDIRRWGIAEKLMHNLDPAPGMKYRDINTNQLDSIIWSGVNWNFQKKNEDYTYPVPFDEYNKNPNLLPQNEGW
jgi:hypothetical protein